MERKLLARFIYTPIERGEGDFYETSILYQARLSQLSKNSIMRQPVEGNTELVFIAPPIVILKEETFARNSEPVEVLEGSTVRKYRRRSRKK